MATKEKAHLSGGPIPNAVLADASELKASLLSLQAHQLARRCAISAAMAAIIAPLVFGEVQP
jgi:hypothetical protein